MQGLPRKTLLFISYIYSNLQFRTCRYILILFGPPRLSNASYNVPSWFVLLGCWFPLHRSAFWGSPRLSVSISESLQRAGCWVSAQILPDIYIYFFTILVISPQLQVCFCLQWPHLWLFFGNLIWGFRSPSFLQGRVLEVPSSFHPPGVVLNWWPQVRSARALPSVGRDTGVTCIPESPALPGRMAASSVSSFSPFTHSFTDFSWSPSLINHVHTVSHPMLWFWGAQPRKTLF